MGYSSTAIFGNDLASDVRATYRELLEDGVSDEEALLKVEKEFSHASNDPDNRAAFWTALAATQVRLGRLDGRVVALGGVVEDVADLIALDRDGDIRVHRLRAIAEHAGDLGMAWAADDVILAAARQCDAIIVTLDADFHQTLAATHSTSPSVVRIRIEGLKGEQLATILREVVSRAAAELASGAVVSVTPGRIRVRTLPIGN